MADKSDHWFVEGFSQKNREEKTEYLAHLTDLVPEEIGQYRWPDAEWALVLDRLSENTVAHYGLPFGVAPNVLVNGKVYVLPLVTEESSVVAAIARAAKIWSSRGGFKASVLGTQKKGQVHFFWEGTKADLEKIEPVINESLLQSSKPLTKNMEARGGGITDLQILDWTEEIPGYFQLDVAFETGEAMGANFINSVLENMASELRGFLSSQFPEKNPPKILMAILSNETPECLAEAFVECPVKELEGIVKGMPADEFAWSFEKALRISKIDRARAVTHNKGIFNGIDALALATGNDWRALEAAGHSFASRDGKYRGLTDVSLEKGLFRFSIKIPVNVGVVGGITSIHPLARFAMKILQNPSAMELMQLFAVVGLASNFSALAALVGNGIQTGHMKLHLQNILAQLGATEHQSAIAQEYFSGRTVSFSAVRTFLNSTE